MTTDIPSSTPLALMAMVGGALLLYSGWTRQNVLDILTGSFGSPTPNPTQSINVSSGGSAVAGAGSSPLSGTSTSTGGVTTFDGKPVASWIVPILRQAR